MWVVTQPFPSHGGERLRHYIYNSLFHLDSHHSVKRPTDRIPEELVWYNGKIPYSGLPENRLGEVPEIFPKT